MASSVVNHSGQLPAASMMARVDRLDLVVGYLEEMRNGGSARSSTSPSTTLSSSSPTSTPRRGSCRPAEELLQETKAKGSLVDRIAFLENRVLKMEEERMSMEITPSSPERMSMNMSRSPMSSGRKEKRNKEQKGIKSLVKSCVRGKLNTKD